MLRLKPVLFRKDILKKLLAPPLADVLSTTPKMFYKRDLNSMSNLILTDTFPLNASAFKTCDVAELAWSVRRVRAGGGDPRQGDQAHQHLLQHYHRPQYALPAIRAAVCA